MKNIIIVNERDLERKVRVFRKGGPDKMHVLSDFDKTLTKEGGKNKEYPSLISFLRNGNYLTRGYSARAHALRDKYYPLEISSKISNEEKTKLMYEWWKTHFELLVECGLDIDTIQRASKDMIKEEALIFRKGVFDFMDIVHEKNIPLVIMSSSIGDIIKEVLRLNGRLYDNVYVIANNLKFNKNKKFIGVKNIIHTMNKHEIELKNLPIYNNLKNRKNVLLLGDSLGDVGMIEGFDYDNLIKIGFYNNAEEGDIERYKKNFDIILTGDTDFNYVNKLADEIEVNKK